MNSKTNVAYDLSIYERNIDWQIVDKEKTTKTNKQENKKQIKFKPKAYTIKKCLNVLQAATILAAAWVLLSVQSNITDYICKNTEIEKEIVALEGEKTYYEFAYNNRMTLDEIEDYAVNQLGMIKSDRSNVRYIELNDENEISSNDPTDNHLEAIWLSFANIFLQE